METSPGRRSRLRRISTRIMPFLVVLGVLCVLWASLDVVHAQSDAERTWTARCSRVCGAFETCFVYNNAEYCAQNCAPGRCNDATEICVLQGRPCDRAPCLPVAVCEPKEANVPADAPDTSAPPSCTRACPMTDSPVCASNGISYANHCFFDQAQCVEPALSFVSTGLCDDAQAFNLAYNPPDTRPSTEDTAHCAAIVCADVLDPVCTSQGTMRNLCYWKKAQCRDASVTLVRRIACEDPDSLMPKCPAECTQGYVPVCASNGVLYGNECLFRQARCLREAQFGITLTARDLSYCQQQLGDSEGGGIDIAALMAASVS